MKVYPLASSSDGNCTIVQSNGTTILIDCGVSLRLVTSAIGRDNMHGIAALFVTHEHSDHVKGIPTLVRRLPHLPVYVHERSFKGRRAIFNEANRKKLNSSEPVEVGSFSVSAFPTHHDSLSSHGFFITDRYSGLNLCYIPDTGHICPVIRERAAVSDILYIECDYDERMLAEYPHYPDELKERIAGPFGHLSNREALDLVENLGMENFQRIVLTHLSPRTNSPQVLMKMIVERFGSSHRFEIAGRTGFSTTNSLRL